MIVPINIVQFVSRAVNEWSGRVSKEYIVSDGSVDGGHRVVGWT